MNSILDDFKMAFRTGNILYQLIVINVVVFVVFNIFTFVLLSMAGQHDLFLVIKYYLAVPSNLSELVFRPWTLLTYMFLHEDFMHILFNMLVLYWFGRIITEYLGQNKILGLYVWGALAGVALYLLAYNTLPLYDQVSQNSVLLGASAGVLAIVVGAATFQPNFVVHLLLIGPVRIKYIAAFIVLMSFYRSVGSNAGGELAHLGGAALGYAFMRQLQNGNDWSRPIVGFVNWVKSFFKPQPKIKVSYRKEEKKSTRSSRFKSRSSASSKKAQQTSQDEIDAILDKISEKGYDALSKEEKQKLFNASKD